MVPRLGGAMALLQLLGTQPWLWWQRRKGSQHTQCCWASCSWPNTYKPGNGCWRGARCHPSAHDFHLSGSWRSLSLPTATVPRGLGAACSSTWSAPTSSNLQPSASDFMGLLRLLHLGTNSTFEWRQSRKRARAARAEERAPGQGSRRGRAAAPQQGCKASLALV